MSTRYIGEFKSNPPFKSEKGGKGDLLREMIWGDPVQIIDDSDPDWVKGKSWGMEGWVASNVLCDQSLLEIYAIDVGQGDGVLVKMPEGAWHLIDAGAPGSKQMTKKGATNFLVWKFLKDLGCNQVSLASIIVSHPDDDHYGGFVDLLSGQLALGGTFNVHVEKLYHPGIGRFDASPKLGAMVQGTVAPFPQGQHGIREKGKFITELLGDKASFTNPARPLQSAFKKFADLVQNVSGSVQRLSDRDKYLPGYAPGQKAVTVHVLGPITETVNGQEGFRWLPGGESKTRNGHSVTLRLDYGDARVLLTGDLNEKSQQLMLSYHPKAEFASDVAKACHHGAEDIDLDFIQAMQARATIISSGDNEDYAHPRPALMGASARYGRDPVDVHGRLSAPLLYSTELARSTKLAYASAAYVDEDHDPNTPPKRYYASDVRIKAGDRNRSLSYLPVATDLVYGLVNVRTDGKHIMCATLEEKGKEFDVRVFKAGV